MKSNHRMLGIVSLTAVVVLLGMAGGALAAEPGFFVEKPDGEQGAFAGPAKLTCKGRVGLVLDAADETVNATPAIFGTAPGGGQGGQFDPAPVLSIQGVSLEDGECLNAHFSVIAGSAQTYGVAPLALFQVTLTSVDGTFGPWAILGHYRTPYGIPSPAVALEAETDVDMLAANFFQSVGDGQYDVPPGTYNVDVWWAGAPPGVPGGAIGAAFVLKLYLRD